VVSGRVSTPTDLKLGLTKLLVLTPSPPHEIEHKADRTAGEKNIGHVHISFVTPFSALLEPLSSEWSHSTAGPDGSIPTVESSILQNLRNRDSNFS
jgi:hypothetical protein